MSTIEILELTADYWAVVQLKDGLIFEGIVRGETGYGVYLLIGGDPSRLNLFLWHTVSRVIYKDN